MYFLKFNGKFHKIKRMNLTYMNMQSFKTFPTLNDLQNFVLVLDEIRDKIKTLANNYFKNIYVVFGV